MNDDCQLATSSNHLKWLYPILLIGWVILLVDQVSKFFVSHSIPLMDSTAYWYPYGGIGVFKNLAGIEFSINYVTNKGAAWGMFGNYPFLLVSIRLVLIVGLIVYLLHFNRDSSWRFPLALIIAGAIGNVIDFFLYGHVVDMLHFVLWGYDFPVFNLADSSISIGIAFLFLLSWFKKKTSN